MIKFSEEVKLSQIKVNGANPRTIKDDKFAKLVNSILVFPQMLELRPIVVTDNHVALGGNMRYRALTFISDMSIADLKARLVDIRDYQKKTPTEQDNLIAYWERWQDNPTAPIIKAAELSDEQQKEFIIKDNVGYGEWDYDMLANDWDAEDLDDWGLDVWQNDTQEHSAIDEDEVPEVDTKSDPKTKIGDIWQLGRHRLMCGDSTDALNYNHLTNGAKIDLVFTDPPYGMKKEADGVLNDNLNYDKLLEFNKQWIPHTFDALKDNGSWYCWGIDEPLMDIYSEILKPMAKQNQITFRNLITWDKGSAQGQLSDEFRMYPIVDEKCLFVMCGCEAAQGFCVNADDYLESMDVVRLYLEQEIKKLNKSDKAIANALGYKDRRTVNHWWSKSQFALPTKENYEALRKYGRSVLKDYGFLKKDYDFLKKDFYAGRSYFNNTHENMNNVWHFDRTGNKERELTGGHATPKPIALCSRAIKSSSREDEIVLDVFGGSGSTLIACEQLNRTCYMMELDPKYCDVILKRWEAVTGEKATLVGKP